MQDILKKFEYWRKDWNRFAHDMLGVRMDPEQQAIIDSVQHNPRTSLASGTARGKDFVSAVAAVSFLYLTPRWNEKGELIHNTKVAMTAPTDRQVGDIMMPEVAKLFNRARHLPGRLISRGIRMEEAEWFLTGFKADEHNHEAWSGFHAVNTMFAVTEASGIPENVFHAIEGNMQGNSRLLIVFNQNTSTGYAAASQRSPRWNRFRLDSLSAPNVLEKREVIRGQVDYKWVKDKVELWCTPIRESEMLSEEGDFLWEGHAYRPNDLFRVKVRGMAPKVSSDVLVPMEWIELANKRWQEHQEQGFPIQHPLRLGVDVGGMGRDASCFCERFGPLVKSIETLKSSGRFVHMEVAGRIKTTMERHTDSFIGRVSQAMIDTIGEGAGVYARLEELKVPGIHSVKASHKAEWKEQPLKDATGQYTFLNMRAYLYWAARDWLNPRNETGAMLPPDDELAEDLTQTKWLFRSDGRIQIEDKDDIKKRIGRSPDKGDAFVGTFYPVLDINASVKKPKQLSKFFH